MDVSRSFAWRLISICCAPGRVLEMLLPQWRQKEDYCHSAASAMGAIRHLPPPSPQTKWQALKHSWCSWWHQQLCLSLSFSRRVRLFNWNGTLTCPFSGAKSVLVCGWAQKVYLSCSAVLCLRGDSKKKSAVLVGVFSFSFFDGNRNLFCCLCCCLSVFASLYWQ